MELQERITDYWNRRSPGFSAAVMDEITNGDGAHVQEAARKLGVRAGAKVLDVGCGPGYFEMLLGGTGAEFHAIDYSEGMAEAAKANIAAGGIEADVRRMDAQDLDYPDSFFDAVVSRNVLWSLPYPEAAYREMARVMKPGAKAYVCDGNYYLHIYDEPYRRRIRRDKGEEKAGSHCKFNNGDVDFKEIEELAKDLPCSRVRRPQWDVEMLCSLPVSDIEVKVRRFDTEDGGRLIGFFELFFTKEGSIE